MIPERTETSIGKFVKARLDELEMRQSDFCRVSGFDQGLLSKIQSGIVTSLSLESILRLAIGLDVAPRLIFDLLGRMDMYDLLMKASCAEIRQWVKKPLGVLPDMEGIFELHFRSEFDKDLKTERPKRRRGSYPKEEDSPNGSGSLGKNLE